MENWNNIFKFEKNQIENVSTAIHVNTKFKLYNNVSYTLTMLQLVKFATKRLFFSK